MCETSPSGPSVDKMVIVFILFIHLFIYFAPIDRFVHVICMSLYIAQTFQLSTVVSSILPDVIG